MNIPEISERLTGKEYFVVGLLGGTAYSMLEIIWRGYTHWTMTLTGGVCLVLMCMSFERLRSRSLWLKCMCGSAIITGLEFTVGCIVNLGLGWNVWDYSDCPLNILGQICLPFSAIWFVLSIPMVYFSNRLHSHRLISCRNQ